MKKIHFISLIIFFGILFSCQKRQKQKQVTDPEVKTEINYGEEIEEIAKKFSLSPEYIKALTVIECSGRKVIPPRFEKSIYKRLKLVKNNDTIRFENITHKTIKNTPDNVLKDMAKSWGPLQLMGYKCIWLNVDIEEIKGENNLFYSIKWVNETYGNYIRKKKYKDAFHIHNTGEPYPKKGSPKTYDPDYVKNGMKYLKYFQDKN